MVSMTLKEKATLQLIEAIYVRINSFIYTKVTSVPSHWHRRFTYEGNMLTHVESRHTELNQDFQFLLFYNSINIQTQTKE